MKFSQFIIKTACSPSIYYLSSYLIRSIITLLIICMALLVALQMADRQVISVAVAALAAGRDVF